jgi:hypothetical protein
MTDPDTGETGDLSQEEVEVRKEDSKLREENNVPRRMQPTPANQ